MARDGAFVEVEVRRGQFSRRSRATKRFDLPLSWNVDRRSAKLFCGPAFISTFVLICVFDAFVGYPWFGTLGAVFFACLACLFFRMRLGLYRLSPGRVTIDSDGFIDDRLGEGRVPWRCVRFGFPCQEGRSSRVSGVRLLLDDDRFTRAVSDQYRKAYLPLVPRRRPILFLDLAGNADGREIAEAIRILIAAAKFD